MSEITKLYENAGVKPDHYHCEGCEYDYEDICPDDCPNSQAIYPPFTAEKQIEILKLILKKRRILDVGYIIEQEKYDCMHYKRVFDSFEEALCADVNYHWQDLTAEENQQVKGILE